MSMDLSVQTFRQEVPYFEAGTMHITKTVATAAEAIPAHAPVVKNSEGKLALLTVSGGSVVTTGLYGLTPDSIKADEEGPVWLTGEYFGDSLVLPEGVTAADVEIPLRNIGIFLK